MTKQNFVETTWTFTKSLPYSVCNPEDDSVAVCILDKLIESRRLSSLKSSCRAHSKAGLFENRLSVILGKLNTITFKSVLLLTVF